MKQGDALTKSGKAPDCGVCNVMLDKVRGMAENHSKLEAFYTDFIEEPLIAGRFLVYSGPTVLLLLDGKEVYRASGFIDIVELERKVDQLEVVCDYHNPFEDCCTGLSHV